MPQQDPNLPDTVVIGAYDGIKNTVAAERLGPRDLEKAVNVDLDDSGQARRRRGQTLMLSGAWHSIKGPIAGKTFGVRNGVLGIIRPLPDFLSLGINIGTAPVTYTEVNDEAFFSSESMSGVVSQAEVVAPWGNTDGQGFWDSPVYAPTDTLGPVAGQLLGDPPKARHITYYKGRIYLAVGKTLWATELYRYHYVDRTKNFMQFEHEITMVVAANDGLWVGTTGGLYFVAGTLQAFSPGEQFRLIPVSDDSVYPDSVVAAPAEYIHPQAQDGPMPSGAALMFMTSGGIIAAFDSGSCFNLTRGKVLLPKGVSAAGLYRQDAGISSYVAAVDSAGAPTSTARIGDYIDAELIRFIPPASIPAPVAITLLTSDTFEIGGAHKVIADCYTERFIPGDSATIAIVAGEGLSVDFIGGGTATSASATLTGTADLNTALNPEIGFTAVIDITPVSPDPSVTMVILIAINDSDPGASAVFHPVGGGVYEIAINHFYDGANHYIPVLTPAPFGHRYRLAFSVSPHFAALSVNGGDVISFDPSADFTGRGVLLEAFMFNGVVGASARIGDIRYYPLVTDTSMLKRLSA